MSSTRPVLNRHGESNVPGLFIVGDLAGAPVIKLAMEQGYRLAHYLASRPDSGDVIVIGAGAAGLSFALEAQALGLGVTVLEKKTLGSTLRELPEGKWIYAEPEGRPVMGRLPLIPGTKEAVLEAWRDCADSAGLPVRENEAVTTVRRRREGGFDVVTDRGEYSARYVILAAGISGTPRRLNVPGEDLPHISHRLYNPRAHQGERIVVVGGGNSAVEAALSLSENNHVTLSYRGSRFHRITKENARRLREARNVDVHLETRATRFSPGACELDGVRHACDRAFVLIGSEPPRSLLRSMGIRLEGDWTWQRAAVLVASFAIAYTIYGAKQTPGQEFWPFTGWGFQALSFFERPWSFWYTVLYTAAITIFGIQAVKRWGFDRRDRFQIWRYASLIGFQWVFFFIIPEFLFQWAVRYQWVGEQLASDPNFTGNAWRAYGIVYAWPLFFYTFFGAPHQVWILWGALLSFVLIPILVLFHGKRYCSWICGCGGLAETLGDRWRHLAPKGEASIKWERMNTVVLVLAVAITAGILLRDLGSIVANPAQAGLEWYRLIVDVWLVGIVPITLYPFMGGKVWCRYWCPLAKMMEFFSAIFTRFRVSRFAISSNEKCIACGECSRNCQVGIDVMRYALKQEQITNSNSSCIGCGICITVCPMHVLTFDRPQEPVQLVQIQTAAR